MTCISNTGPAWVGTGWLMSTIKERGKEELAFKTCTKQPGCLPSYTKGREKGRKTELFQPLS